MITEPQMISVVLVDDHRFVHDAVSIILGTTEDVRLVAHGSNGEEAILLCEMYSPDIVLMDVVMPGMGGVTATSTIHARFPSIRILVLSSFQDHDSVYAMLRSGANGYILKDSLSTDLIDTIRTVHQGKAVFSSDIAAQLFGSPLLENSHYFGLTDREIEVLKHMAEGQNNKEIAHHLVISVPTVKFHIANILRKLDAETRSEALVIAVRNRLV